MGLYSTERPPPCGAVREGFREKVLSSTEERPWRQPQASERGGAAGKLMTPKDVHALILRT